VRGIQSVRAQHGAKIQGEMPDEDLAPHPRRRRGLAQRCRPCRHLSEGYDPLNDFAPVTRMGSYTLMLCIHPDIPAPSVKELIA
jgi:hypothetical protein